MKCYGRGFSLLILVICSCVVDGKLPSYIQRCSRNDPRISECILNSINNLRPALSKGDFLREIDAPQIEPFKINQLAFGNEKTLAISVRNIVARGGSGFVIEKLRTNLKDFKIDIIIRLPRLELTGKYNFILQFLNAPVRSEGEFLSIVEGTKARINIKGFMVNKNGRQHLQFQPLQIKILPGTPKKLELSNLFGGNKILSEIVHALLLNNKEFLLNDITPYIEKELSKIFTIVANKAIADEPYDELFPV